MNSRYSCMRKVLFHNFKCIFEFCTNVQLTCL
uniref:Uncharacterized protein n=1 Tax=Anguilla anguilla TaxID=7936 RepID=A0A0E9WEU2_ANGAN